MKTFSLLVRGDRVRVLSAGDRDYLKEGVVVKVVVKVEGGISNSKSKAFQVQMDGGGNTSRFFYGWELEYASDKV